MPPESEPAPPLPAPFGATSLRGRIAFAAASLEELVQHFDLRGPAFDELVERLWRPVVAPTAEWRTAAIPTNLADIAALFARPLSDPELEAIRLALNAVRDVLYCASDPAASTRARTEDFLRELSAVLERAGATGPVPAFFAERSPIHTDGFGEHGRAVPPVYFREGIAWEELGPALRRGLCALSVPRRREAAFATSHFGLPSRELELVLRRTVRDPDEEVRRHSLAAWHRLFADCDCPPGAHIARPSIPDFRERLQERDAKWSPPAAGVEAILAALDDRDHPDARRRAIERCRPFLADSPKLCDRLTELLSDSPPEVRMAAAIWLSEAPFRDERLAALLFLARIEPERNIRAAALFAVGTFGPRASAAVEPILEILSQVYDPMVDPTAFYAAEALESIGAVAFRRISANIYSGRPERTERWLRSLALRPDLADRLVEEITREATPDQAWLMRRVQRAVAILRPGER